MGIRLVALGVARVHAEVSALLLPSTVAPFVGVIAPLGVLLYIFTVGLDLHPDLIKE
jgi:hypothetical protein